MNNLSFRENLFFQTVKNDFKGNLLLTLFVLVLITIPLNNFINNLFLVLFFVYCLCFFKKTDFFIAKEQVLLVLLYFVMMISYTWTVDKDLTIKALSKEMPLFLISVCFLFTYKSFSQNKSKIIKYYSYSILLLTLFFFFKAFLDYFISNNLNVFFYHNLVSKELNAIHVSVFVSIALFYFLIKDFKKKLDYIITIYLFLFLLLLSSKIIIFTTIILGAIYFFFYSRSANKMRFRNLIILAAVIFTFGYFEKIKEKLKFEFNIKSESNIGHTVINKKEVGSNIISMKEAWYNEKFNQTDYFSGTSFRVYQTRLFFEFLKEENIFWKGFGLNASYKKLEEKGIHYNVFQGNNEVEGYQKKNFHNQYFQTFAELGVIGFVLLIVILAFNLKNALKNKNFIHIAFAILMISLFLTESFLWRQRGVVFFTLFYCLFNAKNYPQIRKN